jgi:hypothetical protein
MLSKFKNHVDRFLLQNHFFQSDHVLMRYLPVKLDITLVANIFELTCITYCYFPNRALTDPRICDDVPFLVRLKLLDRMYFPIL